MEKDIEVLEENQTEDTQFVPAPDGCLYAEVGENHKLIVINQVEALARGLPAVEFEQAWDGALYEKGYAPEKPEEEIKRTRIAELKAQLDGTDYVILKIAESEDAEEQAQLREHYADVIVNRKSWRAEINTLESRK